MDQGVAEHVEVLARALAGRGGVLDPVVLHALIARAERIAAHQSRHGQPWPPAG